MQNFDKMVNRKGSFCTQWDYIADRFGEADLLPFSVSDTDFEVPQQVMASIHQRLEHQVLGYTRWNHNYFKNAVIQWYEKQFDTKIMSEWIVYSPTVMYSISQLIQMKSNIGEGIIIHSPAYDAFFKTIKANKRIVVENRLIYENGQYEIDFNLLEKQLANPNNTIFLLCSPHNPTGRVWQVAELEKIVRLCKKHQVFIISDEIHMDVIRNGYSHQPLSKIGNKNIAICTSASKTFNIPGLVFSYCLLPEKKLREEFLYRLKEKDGLSSSSILGMVATITAYEECSDWVKQLNNYLDNNVNLVKEFVKTNLPKVKFVLPEATYLVWLDLSAYTCSAKEIQEALIHEGKVAIMSGETYGEHHKNFLRLNIGCSKDKLVDGLNRMKKGLDSLG